jgi:ABC-2 type transport system ATP-binding protein
MKDLLGSLNVQGFVFDLESPLNEAPKIEGFPLKLEDPLTLIAAVSKDRSINSLFGMLTEKGIKVKSMRNEANRLEELFIEMVKK